MTHSVHTDVLPCLCLFGIAGPLVGGGGVTCMAVCNLMFISM